MTTKPLKNSISLDWFSATLFCTPAEAKKKVNFLNSQGFALRNQEKGRSGYNFFYKSAQFPGLQVLYADYREDMGLHIDVSGSQLAILPILTDLLLQGWSPYFYTNNNHSISYVDEKSTTPQALQNAVKQWVDCKDAKITRFDLALDLVEPYPVMITPKELYDEMLHGNMTSKFKSYRWVSSSAGDTLYLGKRTSYRFFRCYDKAAQQGMDSYWTRMEFELKSIVAQQFAELFCELGYNAGFRAILDSSLRLLDPGSHDTNVTRHKTSERWEQLQSLIGAALRPFRVIYNRSRQFSERTVAWIESTLAHVLTQYCLFKRGNLKKIFDSKLVTMDDLILLLRGCRNEEKLYNTFTRSSFDLSHYDFSFCFGLS